MSIALEMVARELQQEIKACGFEVNIGSHILVTRDLAMRMKPHETTAYYRKFISDIIKKYQDKKKAEQQARQVSLL